MAELLPRVVALSEKRFDTLRVRASERLREFQGALAELTRTPPAVMSKRQGIEPASVIEFHKYVGELVTLARGIDDLLGMLLLHREVAAEITRLGATHEKISEYTDDARTWRECLECILTRRI
jgi:hypothetical protein